MAVIWWTVWDIIDRNCVLISLRGAGSVANTTSTAFQSLDWNSNYCQILHINGNHSAAVSNIWQSQWLTFLWSYSDMSLRKLAMIQMWWEPTYIDAKSWKSLNCFQRSKTPNGAAEHATGWPGFRCVGTLKRVEFCNIFASQFTILCQNLKCKQLFPKKNYYVVNLINPYPKINMIL